MISPLSKTSIETLRQLLSNMIFLVSDNAISASHFEISCPQTALIYGTVHRNGYNVDFSV